MPRIHDMSPELVAHVAAGEVVENPASAVKELIENALDAGATHVRVEIENGGLRTLRVADDGVGMDAIDAAACFRRHATSKLQDQAGLSAIRSYGFRGEALAAIMTVGDVTLETQERGAETGWSIRASYGVLEAPAPHVRRSGSTFTVRHLFHQTPARLRFLGTPQAEGGRVVKVVREAALARPDVSFTCSELLPSGQQGTVWLDCTATGDLKARIAQIHGAEFAASLVPVVGSREGLEVRGYVTRPDAASRQARRTVFTVNGRVFADFDLKRVLRSAMSAQLYPGNYPDAILHFTLPPNRVDPNCSPDKSTMRFSDGDLLSRVLYRAIEAAVSTPSPVGSAPAAVGAAAGGTDDSIGWTVVDESALATQALAAAAVGGRTSLVDYRPLGFFDGGAEADRGGAPFGAMGGVDTAGLGHGARVLPETPAVLFQVANAFLVVALDEGLLYVDQHSAHERVLYEEAVAGLEAPTVQPLLFPEDLPLVDAEARLALEALLPTLQALGFEIEPSGPRTYWVAAAPGWLGDASPATAVRQAVDLYRDPVSRARFASDQEALRARVLRTMACHGAVRAGEALSPERMQALWQRIRTVDLALADIHGRPGAVFIPHTEIARRLQRGGLPGR
jgi:DNA mismatch repair protein MutL